MSRPTCPTCRREVYRVGGNPDEPLRHSADGSVAVTADGHTVCELSVMPLCPTCGRAVYRVDRRYTLGSPARPGMAFGTVDPILRHSEDGTVAVQADGTVVCEMTATEAQGVAG
jgi:endogenous inhibitor of DNA gyrase (YacG/DUF329 family)